MRKFDGKRLFGFGGRDRSLQLPCLLEITIGLARRNGAVLRQLFDNIGKLIRLLKQNPGAIESLGLLGTVGARHLS